MIVCIERRPPCPPNYVRLIDFAAVLLMLQAFLLVTELGVVLAARRRGPHRVAGTLAIVLGVVVALALVPSAALAMTTFRAGQYDAGCWTF
jgi:hypothetical protein